MKKILFSLLMLCSMTAAWAIPIGDGTYIAATLSELQAAINGQLSDGTSTAVIKLTADIYLNDCPELCRTFKGTLDGNGYTIYAGDENAHHDGRGLAHGKYLFTYSEGATFKNLTFKDFRADTDEHSNWSFLTSQATDGCVFENITFDHVSIWAKYDNGGAVAGYANGCTFKNITVKNGDFTVSRNSAGTVVGHATSCTFTNIEVSNCEATAERKHAGGVVGHSNNCTFTDINVHDCNITAHVEIAGGVAGIAENNSSFTNIKVLSSVMVAKNDYVGGVVGTAKQSSFSNIEVNKNEATLQLYSYAGGVAGSAENCSFADIEVHEAYIYAEVMRAGGVAGESVTSTIVNSIVDDLTRIYALSQEECATWCFSGGVVGHMLGGSIANCKSSALVAGPYEAIGGIVGYAGSTENGEKPVIENCLNTGLVAPFHKSKFLATYPKYKNKELQPETKIYNGKEYTIQKLSSSQIENWLSKYRHIGGVAGDLEDGSISKCVNLGSVYSLAGRSGKNGGIAGHTIGACTVSDCFSDFSYNKDDQDQIGGIVGESSSNSKVVNCLTMTDNEAIKVNNSSTCSNNYTLKAGVGNAYQKSVTEAQVASGEACILLGAAWDQNLGVDAYPIPTGGSKGLYHTRNVSNQYGTACFPFSVKSDDEISYYTFNEASVGDDIKLMFKYAKDMIPAGTPVLFRAADAVEATEPVEVCFSHYGDGFTKYPNSPTLPVWGMEGTFEQRVFEGEAAKEIYYVSGGEIRNAKKTTIAPYRAWIYGPSIETLNGSNGAPAKSISFVVEDEDGTVTALRYDNENVNPMHNAEFIMHNYYNLNGQRVSANHKGIVIKDGKKCVNK